MSIDMPTHVSDPEARADVGVIGGSGFATFLRDATPISVYTPFGEPSDPPLVGEVAGRRVAFLPRHGRDHALPPHRVNYRANLWALRALGVRQVVAASAVGSLLAEQGPGTVVVPDQLIDRTTGRPRTIYERADGVVHVGFAEPYCPTVRAALLASRRASEHTAGGEDTTDAGAADGPAAATDPGASTRDSGTLVVIDGPRFSTRAESAANRAAGGTLVGMTSMPEAAIARELAMCLGLVALVTDLDAGVGPDDAATHTGVFDALAAHRPRMRAVVEGAIERLPEPVDDTQATCGCRRALDGIRLPFPLPS